MSTYPATKLTASRDYNSTLADSLTFDCPKGVQGSFDRFLTECFDPTEETEMDQAMEQAAATISTSNSPALAAKGKETEGGQSGAGKASGKTIRVMPKGPWSHDAKVKVLNAEGDIWVPDLTSASCS